jgi:hypothetical protein
MQGFEKTAQKP